MKKMQTAYIPIVAGFLIAGSAILQAQQGPPGPPPGYGYHDQDRDREWGPPQPPREFSDFARQGYHDGVEAARRDIHERRRPDAHHHGEFRHPPVPRPARDDYRRGFDHGYRTVFEHAGPPPR